MKLNLKVRFNNWVFWVQIILAIVTPVATYFGITAQDLTTWAMVGDIIVKAVSNPFVVVSVIINIVAVLNDPTTSGLGDSVRALGYTVPYKSGKE